MFNYYFYDSQNENAEILSTSNHCCNILLLFSTTNVVKYKMINVYSLTGGERKIFCVNEKKHKKRRPNSW